MEIAISNLLKQREDLIKGLAEKFRISLTGATEFLKLAIIDWIKTNYTLQISNQIISGDPKILHKLEYDVLNWVSDEFDDDDFQIIGYCKNIR